ncbi:MAG TPA: GNAT family N-acetyltransferase [Luteimonas sp.]|nr:GNAT family N-acetyltransferase [Luteimonas sp.]HRO26470.1 GNAT family N-acetyltransferase [Luteimonas sp.]HRP73530.1 GNAT family N-acetyltransferase [Luteimonas sp.]
MPFALRRATAEDADTVAALAARTFVETFGHQYPPDDLASFLRDAYSADRQRTILSHPDYAIWLLEDEGEAIGHVAAGPCGLPHPDVATGDGEIKRLYLRQGWQSGGHGARLMDAAMDWLLQGGPRTLWVGVWSENFGAQRFYERRGFRKAGEYLFEVGGTRDREFILRRPAGQGGQRN